jgi:CYTH domain-containing protein
VPDAPKYSRPEIERRWLVDLTAIDLRDVPFREIDDLYIADTRLRLRRISGPNELVFKLCRKYGKTTRLSEPITNLYLSETEYRILADLPGNRSRKRRYPLERGSLDVYVQPNLNMAVFEVEFDDEPSATQYDPPAFVTREVTNETAYSGASLARER